MRERTTWNRQEIASASSQGRTAEDPRAMNQDHLQQQPAADAYVTGGPSEFAEDVHPPEGTWKAEYAGGETKRNEIGMPEFRGDTFKNAGLDEETLNKKAEVCIKVARDMLPHAVESAVEDQAYALMHLPDVELIETATRLAKGQVPPEFLEQQQKMKDKAKDGDDKKDDDEDAKKAASALQAGDSETAQAIIASMVQRQVRAAQQKQESDDEDEAEAKQAAQKKQQQDQQQDADPEGGQQGGQQQQQMDEADEEDATQQKQAFTIAEQVQQMVQQAVQQQQQQAQQQQQQQAQQQMQQQGQQQQRQAVPPGIAGCGIDSKVLSDDQMLDQMLQQEMQQGEQEMFQGEPMDIQLEGAPMDIGEVQLGPEDAVLGQLFASNQEVMEAQQAEALRTGIPVQHQAPVTVAGTTRTASTRTVGTRPTGGVSQLGGAAAASTSDGNEIDKLSSMWRSAPDMSGVFNGE